MNNYVSIKIKDAMKSIASNEYVLPKIQRKFEWTTKQIERLFDSIMRDYPINAFLFWEINSDMVQECDEFYCFLRDYVERFNENNKTVSTKLLKQPFYAIIDGQQRLTSLYIGLSGSYRIKTPNKRWIDNEDSMPTRELYLNLSNPLNSEFDNEKFYDFRFLTINDYKELSKTDFWFKVKNVLNFKGLVDVTNFLLSNNLQKNQFSIDTLVKLYVKIDVDKVINYYLVEENNLEKVLEIFLRTNSGGTPLTFSKLLMSTISANWKTLDAREEFDGLIKEIYNYGNPRFVISQDFILKCLLVLSDLDVRFRIVNFDRTKIQDFKKNWEEIRKAIVSTFVFLEKLGFNDLLLKSKNAVIPICYYVYKQKLSKSIVKDNFSKDDRERISKWLIKTLLKGIFGGQSDSVLTEMRKIIKGNSKKEYFPSEEIINGFNKTNKNYVFNKNIINDLLEEQWQSTNANLILYLLYSNIVLKNGNAIAIDHIHPKSNFMNKKTFKSIGFTDTTFASDKKNWNSVKNLQILSSSANQSKLDKPLIEWAKDEKITNKELYLSKNTSLDIKDFKDFIEDREKNLLDKLTEILI